ncbi:hypothetical protein U1Q18_010969 [Sarracenia purpurea var. burkii]
MKGSSGDQHNPGVGSESAQWELAVFGRSRRLRSVAEEEEGCDAGDSEGSGEEEELQSAETSGLRIRWAIIRCGGPAVEDWALKQGIVFANFADLRQKEEDLVAEAYGGEERKEIGQDFGVGHREEPAKKACRISSRRRWFFAKRRNCREIFGLLNREDHGTSGRNYLSKIRQKSIWILWQLSGASVCGKIGFNLGKIIRCACGLIAFLWN